MSLALLIYAAGVAIALFFTDARPPARLGLALAWPVGPATFAVTIALLLVASLVIFPAFGSAVALAALTAWWLLG